MEQDRGRNPALNRAELLERLANRVSADERDALEKDDGLIISRYNRATLLRMLKMRDSLENPGDPIDAARAEALENALRAYLNRYMADQPQGHKWIVLSCLFLAFVAGEPMHPQAIVRWTKRGSGYVCPARDATEGSLCRWCVCRGEDDDATVKL